MDNWGSAQSLSSSHGLRFNSRKATTNHFTPATRSVRSLQLAASFSWAAPAAGVRMYVCVRLYQLMHGMSHTPAAQAARESEVCRCSNVHVVVSYLRLLIFFSQRAKLMPYQGVYCAGLAQSPYWVLHVYHDSWELSGAIGFILQRTRTHLA